MKGMISERKGILQFEIGCVQRQGGGNRNGNGMNQFAVARMRELGGDTGGIFFEQQIAQVIGLVGVHAGADGIGDDAIDGAVALETGELVTADGGLEFIIGFGNINIYSIEGEDGKTLIAAAIKQMGRSLPADGTRPGAGEMPVGQGDRHHRNMDL